MTIFSAGNASFFKNIKQAMGIQVTFNLKSKLQKEHFFSQNVTASSGIYASIFNPSPNGNVHTYATISD